MREITRQVLSSILHQLNTVKVGHRIADSRVATWICGEGPVLANLRYGAKALVYAHEYSGRAMFLWGESDPRISAVIRAVLRPGDTALDIGANFGVTGLLAAKCIGRTGRLHLFEPQSDVAQCLKASMLINGYTQATVHECALSDHSGSAVMCTLGETDTSTAALVNTEHVRNHSGPTFERTVKVEDASKYIPALGCESVNLIKIDVEGHEAVIFKAIQNWLLKIRPPVILFECLVNGKEFDSHPSTLILSDLGYDFLCIDVRPYWKVKLYTPNKTNPANSRDFVAVRWQDLDADRTRSLRAMAS